MVTLKWQSQSRSSSCRTLNLAPRPPPPSLPRKPYTSPPTPLQELHDAVHVHKWHDAGFLAQYGAYTRIDIPLVIKQNLVGKVGRLRGG